MGPIPVIGFGETADTAEEVQNAKFGLGASSNDLADLVHARYILIFWRNAADTDHSEMRFLFDAMEARAKVVVVDPRFSRTAAKADEWIGRIEE